MISNKDLSRINDEMIQSIIAKISLSLVNFESDSKMLARLKKDLESRRKNIQQLFNDLKNLSQNIDEIQVHYRNLFTITEKGLDLILTIDFSEFENTPEELDGEFVEITIPGRLKVDKDELEKNYDDMSVEERDMIEEKTEYKIDKEKYLQLLEKIKDDEELSESDFFLLSCLEPAQSIPNIKFK